MSTFVLLKVLPTLALSLVVLTELLFFPIAALVHCVRNPDLSGGAKALWAVFIFFMWSFGASVYGITVSGRTLFKWLGYVFLIALIPATLAKKPLAAYLAQKQRGIIVQNIERVQLVDLSEPDRAILKNELDTLDVSKEVPQDLVKLLDQLIRKGQLKRNELMEWQRLYQTQDTLDDKALKSLIIKIQVQNLRTR